jgi:DNA-binding CsgD family transcriptional regulator
MTAPRPTRQRSRHNSATALPGLTMHETRVLQLRAEGHSYPSIQSILGIAPRKCWDVEKAALRKLLHYIETNQFLGRV